MPRRHLTPIIPAPSHDAPLPDMTSFPTTPLCSLYTLGLIKQINVTSVTLVI